MKEKLAYLAGVIDSDGCIHIERCKDNRINRKPRFQYKVRLQIGVTSMATINWIVENFPLDKEVQFYTVKPTKKYRKPIYLWQLNTKNTLSILKKVLPYLVLKKPRAKIALEFERTLCEQHESRKKGCEKQREEKKKLKEILYQKMRILNKKGV